VSGAGHGTHQVRAVQAIPGQGVGNLRTHKILSHVFFMSPEFSLILACHKSYSVCVCVCVCVCVLAPIGFIPLKK
jgi:hypothetical protein